MNRESLIERAYAKTDLDFNQLESLTDSQLRELLDLSKPDDAPVKPKPRAIRAELIGFEFVEHEGALFRLETWCTGSIEQRVRVRCGATVRFQDKTVSSSIVLHWLKTGELVKRVPRARKQFQAAVRVGDKVKHLGRFATREERDAAILTYRLNPAG